MKSFAFVAALIAATQAVELEWQSYSYQPATYSKSSSEGASKAYAGDYDRRQGTDYDRWGRDQDYKEDVSYSKTSAKSYGAKSFDSWDNTDDDKWGQQAWGQDRDKYGASSYGKAASAGDYDNYGYGKDGGYGGWGGYGKGGYGGKSQAAYGASAAGAAAKGGYDNDAWAKQAHGSDYDSRIGQSYDSVTAKSYDDEQYSRDVWADDDQWAEDWDSWNSGDKDYYGRAASSKKGGNEGASRAYGAGYGGKSASDWDAWGRDQDFKQSTRYGKTAAKSYDARSFDSWNNADNDKWGQQAWGQDRDVYGASSYGQAASSAKYGNAKGGYDGGYGGYGGYGGKGGYGGDSTVWTGASKSYGAAKGGYDNDAWAKQAHGSDFDSRYGESYDSVEAKSYNNEEYSNDIWADDDQWAEDYDRYDWGEKDYYGKAASETKKESGWDYGKDGYGYGWGRPTYTASESKGASKAYGGDYDRRSGSDWDAWGRDQDYKLSESYKNTDAKSYGARSYDSWKNVDDDKWGQQAWGVDRDVYGASSYGKAASEGDYDNYGYGKQGGYGGWGGYGGYGKGYGGYGKAAATDKAASYAGGAAKSGYDNDAWAKQAHGADFDSRWGQSYDDVEAKSYNNQQYKRSVWADDDQWAEDYDRWADADDDYYGKAASAS